VFFLSLSRQMLGRPRSGHSRFLSHPFQFSSSTFDAVPLPQRLHGVMLNQLRTGTTLPFTAYILMASCHKPLSQYLFPALNGRVLCASKPGVNYVLLILSVGTQHDKHPILHLLYEPGYVMSCVSNPEEENSFVTLNFPPAYE
jgi:hypothetical protein